MKQAGFEARHAGDWEAFERWLEAHGKRLPGRAARDPALLSGAEVPQAYRRLCQHLALARDREYSPQLVDRLNALVLRGHHALYGARAGRAPARALAFLAAGFPRLVRAEGRLFAAALALFFVPLGALIAALQWAPDFIYYVLDPRTVAGFREMYDPAAARLGRRGSEDSVAMFGFYVWNNVKVGIQTFATGLAFGIGSVYYLVANGVVIGAVAGYLTQAGQGEMFWSFVSGHSALELIAIAVSGAAGLRLGAAAIAPGGRSRRAAIAAAARPAVQLMTGAGAMFVAAAFVEAFWSPLNTVPPATKIAAGLVAWAIVAAWLALGGRARGA